MLVRKRTELLLTKAPQVNLGRRVLKLQELLALPGELPSAGEFYVCWLNDSRARQYCMLQKLNTTTVTLVVWLSFANPERSIPARVMRGW
jgi:hypothetical protein